jgi:hypothetical protein
VDATEKRASRDGILDELGGLFRAAYAWGTWGRLLVHVSIGEGGRPEVIDVAVEDIVGDERRLQAAFEGPEVRASLPAVGRAVEALLALEGLEIESMGGGTFLHTADARLAFLPGLVRCPSAAFEGARDAADERVRQRSEELGSRFGLGVDAQLAGSGGAALRVRRGAAEVAGVEGVILGTFSRQARSFVWAAANPSLSEAARKATSALLDAMPDRSAWEVSTFGFTTDEPTAWSLCAWVCDVARGEGLVRMETDEGPVFVLIRAV